MSLPALAPLKDPLSACNQTEREYGLQILAAVAAGDVVWWAYEPFTMAIGAGARYTPDFGIQSKSGEVYFVEVKGPFVREASLVRIRAAATQYPFRFLLAQKTRDRGWVTKLVGAVKSSG
jgi:hypothetical protein